MDVRVTGPSSRLHFAEEPPSAREFLHWRNLSGKMEGGLIFLLLDFFSVLFFLLPVPPFVGEGGGVCIFMLVNSVFEGLCSARPTLLGVDQPTRPT